MPSSINTTPPTLPANGFRPEFFRSYTTAPESRVSWPGDENRPRTSYSAERHGSHTAFCAGEHFAQYREEMRENLDFLVALCKQLGMSDAPEIEQKFRIFHDHRFVEAYFDTHAELVDSAGKRSLDNFCAMLRDERLPADRKKAAIRNLSGGVTLCASGAVAHLVAADRELSLSVGGIRGKLWKVKEDVARNVLQQAMSEQFDASEDYRGDEIHYVHAAWNYMAHALGLNPIPDWMAPRLKPDFLLSCQEKVIAALSPDKIAMAIAEECLAEFGSRVDLEPESSSGECTSEQVEWFFEVLNDIRRDLGMTESELSMNAFVRLDDGGQRYHVRTDPSLIALELLKAMNANNLLADAPIYLGDGKDEDGAHIALYSYGSDLAWRMRQSMIKNSAPSWSDHIDVDAIDAAVLRAWPRANGPNTVNPPAMAIRQVLRGTDPADLMSVRAEWLGTAESILALLKRLDYDQALQYLDANLPYLRTGLPSAERRAFINEVMGIGEPDLVLARAWYPHPWALLAEPIENNTMTRLEYWIQADHARGIDAVCDIVGDGWSIKDHAVSMGDAIFQGLSGIGGRSIVWHAVHSRSPNAIAALHRLLVHSLSDPTFRKHVRPRLLELFSGKNHVVPMLYRLDDVSAEVIAAFHRMVLDPLILPHIIRKLPTILLGDRPDDKYPMWEALLGKNASVIKAYGALVADVAGMPGMGKWLPRLIMPNRFTGSVSLLDGLNEHALLALSWAGAAEVIQAYHAILVHPAILPQIEHLLPELLLGGAITRGKTPVDLRDSFLNPRLGGYNAYREMVMDPLIVSHVLEWLPPPLRDQAVEAGIAESDAVVVTSVAITENTARRSIGKHLRRLLRRVGF